MAFAIEMMIVNKEFNGQLLKVISEEEQSYVNRVMEKVLKVKERVFSKVLGATEIQFSYIDEVITTHMILITKTLFEMEAGDFNKISEEAKSFYQMILMTLAAAEDEDNGGLKDL